MATTGAPAAIASTSTLGMPSRSSGSSRHGMHSALARRYSASSSAWPSGPGRRTRPSRPWRRIAAAHRVAVLVVLADDQRLERHAAALQHARTPRPARRSPSWRPAARRRGRAACRCAARWRGAARRAAARSRRSARGRRAGRRASGAIRRRWRDVGLGARDGEARGEQLAPQPAVRVEVAARRCRARGR